MLALWKGFFFPLGFSKGHATLKGVSHASVHLHTILVSSCGYIALTGSSVERLLTTASLYTCQLVRIGFAKLTGRGVSSNNLHLRNSFVARYPLVVRNCLFAWVSVYEYVIVPRLDTRSRTILEVDFLCNQNLDFENKNNFKENRKFKFVTKITCWSEQHIVKLRKT